MYSAGDLVMCLGDMLVGTLVDLVGFMEGMSLVGGIWKVECY